MIKYHNAFDSAGNIINISDVTPENRSSLQFSCIGCGAEMNAVLGQKREHHFRHEKDCSCSPETYLHKYGKRIIKHRFDTQDQFLVQYFAHNNCPNAPQCQLEGQHNWEDCSTTTPILKTVDLKKFYDTCEVETTHKGFRPDLMLTYSEDPSRSPVFLEISVTHDCDQPKIDSRVRIIEIKVQSESDVLRTIVENEGGLVPTPNNVRTVYHQTLPSPIRFYNFKRNLKEDGLHTLDRFYLFRDEAGAYGWDCEFSIPCHHTELTREKDACFEVSILGDSLSLEERRRLPALGVVLSRKKGFDIKDCRLCSSYEKCTLFNDIEDIDPVSGETRITRQRVMNKSLPASQHNKLAQASGCPKYRADEYYCRSVINSFRHIPYWEWSKGE